MTTTKNEYNISIRHILVPICLLSVTVFLLLGYQTTQILRDRDALNVTLGQQTKSFEDSKKLQNQLNALLTGTQRLADEGNQNAKVIADKLKELGIQIQTPGAKKAAATTTRAPVPVANEKEEISPVKP